MGEGVKEDQGRIIAAVESSSNKELLSRGSPLAVHHCQSYRATGIDDVEVVAEGHRVDIDDCDCPFIIVERTLEQEKCKVTT